MENSKEQFERFITDDETRKYILELYKKVIEVSHTVVPNNWNVCNRKGENRFQLNCGNKYVLAASLKYLLVMCNREEVLSLNEGFVNELLTKGIFYTNDLKLKQGDFQYPRNFVELKEFPKEALWHNTFQFKIEYKDILALLPSLEKSILNFAEWTTLDKPLLPASKTGHSIDFIDYLNQELGVHLPQPEYAEEKKRISTGDPTMAQKNTLVEKNTDLLKSTKNLILTGAPGTGKTYLARQIAQAMGCSPQEIGFVQFHPSYDYTDFVEGLRPVQDESGSGQIGFERKDGVFKEFCARALKNLQDSRKSESELKSELSLKEKIDAFLLKAKENGDKFYTSKENVFFIKTYNEKKVVVMYKTKDGTISDTVSIKYSDLEKLLKENRKIERSEVKLLTGRAVERQEDSYSSVLINNMLAEPSECIVVKENNIELKNFVFIIDEINRGEVSKIFGELFYSVDPGYRVSVQELEAVRANEKQLATIKTQYANLETDGNDFDRALNSADYGHFFIPENVFIIGTMNDIDRSVESMDFAFRRRFTWVEVKAEETQDMLDEKLDEKGQTRGLPDGLAQEAKKRMNRLNEAISKISGLNEAYHIGASYFLKLNEYDGDFNKLWDYHLKGLLHEYLRGSGNEASGMESLQKAYFGEGERLELVPANSIQEQ
ncbi:MAG: AAA family ATPase [Treponema sp.]|nr:AAA family ATPase [Treponema sp.]